MLPDFSLSQLMGSALPDHLAVLGAIGAISAGSAQNLKALIILLPTPSPPPQKKGILLHVEGIQQITDRRFPLQEEILPSSTQPPSSSLSHEFQGVEKQLKDIINSSGWNGNSSFIGEDLTSYTQQKLTLIPTDITIPLSAVAQQGKRAIQTIRSTTNALMNFSYCFSPSPLRCRISQIH